MRQLGQLDERLIRHSFAVCAGGSAPLGDQAVAGMVGLVASSDLLCKL